MREIFFGILLLFMGGPASAQLVQAVVAGTPATSGIVIVQHKSTFCLSASTCALAFTSNNGSANLLIYATVADGASLTAATDSNTNTIVNALTFSSNGAERIDYVTSSNSGANTVTAHASTSAHIHIHIWEVSGLASGVSDASGTGTQATATALTISTSGATVVNNELVFGLFNDAFNCFTYTAGTGFSPTEATVDCTGSDSVFTEVKTVTTTGTQTATATLSTADNTDNLVVTFK